MLDLPVKKTSGAQQLQITTLINELLDKKIKDATANTAVLENKIDEIIYKLYNISEEERIVIESF